MVLKENIKSSCGNASGVRRIPHSSVTASLSSLRMSLTANMFFSTQSQIRTAKQCTYALTRNSYHTMSPIP